MTYATQQDLVDRFGTRELIQLTDTTQSGQIDASRVSIALSDADREIDMYLSRRYDLPLASTPAGLKVLAADIARYKLYTHAPPEEVTERYKGARSVLSDIAKGLAGLAGVSATLVQKGITVKAPVVVFDDATLDKMI